MNTPYRVGIGHDTHRLIPGDGFHLGGIPIPHDKKLLGVSDADVLLHAVIDALLGAAGLGDIGDMFPDTDEINRDRSSVEMLRLAWQRVQNLGWKLQNLDCIVFAQRPKLGSYKTVIAESIAETLGVTPQQVNVKAKTGEGIGPVGEELVIEAQCVALLSGFQSFSDLKAKSHAASRSASVVPGVSPVPSASSSISTKALFAEAGKRVNY
ncbi:MAG: 2-C-methyl-D-erythritol 2,4-cyclodiphosphate synthase [Thermoguttaceae bacterium]|nr:2-C-methyl-D-erythritol 2,4-cyclodiphosphate synthase [Thermoguttaceae bacterium]MBR0191796.1 2-C-methyl-D-erythritol 2,4-cyclodiphosphate synthase [Thermoguttaceae bacterium]